MNKSAGSIGANDGIRNSNAYDYEGNVKGNSRKKKGMLRSQLFDNHPDWAYDHIENDNDDALNPQSCSCSCYPSWWPKDRNDNLQYINTIQSGDIKEFNVTLSFKKHILSNQRWENCKLQLYHKSGNIIIRNQMFGLQSHFFAESIARMEPASSVSLSLFVSQHQPNANITNSNGNNHKKWNLFQSDGSSVGEKVIHLEFATSSVREEFMHSVEFQRMFSRVIHQIYDRFERRYCDEDIDGNKSVGVPVHRIQFLFTSKYGLSDLHAGVAARGMDVDGNNFIDRNDFFGWFSTLAQRRVSVSSAANSQTSYFSQVVNFSLSVIKALVLESKRTTRTCHVFFDPETGLHFADKPADDNDTKLNPPIDKNMSSSGNDMLEKASKMSLSGHNLLTMSQSSQGYSSMMSSARLIKLQEHRYSDIEELFSERYGEDHRKFNHFLVSGEMYVERKDLVTHYCPAENGKVRNVSGTMILTNFRLIFVSYFKLSDIFGKQLQYFYGERKDDSNDELLNCLVVDSNQRGQRPDVVFSMIAIPLMSIASVEPSGHNFTITSKDFVQHTFGFDCTSATVADFANQILDLTWPKNIPALFAFATYQVPVASYIRKFWKIFDPAREFARQGISFSNYDEDISSVKSPKALMNISSESQKFDSSKMMKQASNLLESRASGKVRQSNPVSHTPKFRLFNDNYVISPTYPASYVVPAELTDEQIKEIAKFRSRARIPAISWVSKQGIPLARCSQPNIGWGGKRSAADEYCVQLLANGYERIYFVDARGIVAAVANQIARGKGAENPSNYENSVLIFMGIGNIHTMRSSFCSLMNLCSGRTKSQSSNSFLKDLYSSRWMEHIQKILMASVRVAEIIALEKCPVIVHCSDGWDRSSQISSLAQILLDPYYRTVEGFAVLVEKEWCSFGYKFSERTGHNSQKEEGIDASNEMSSNHNYGEGNDTRKRGMQKPNERSPVFLQFVDCVYQLMHQFPTHFEFNELFLISIVDELLNCRFGNFLFNSERERMAADVPHRTFSIWAVFLEAVEEPSEFLVGNKQASVLEKEDIDIDAKTNQPQEPSIEKLGSQNSIAEETVEKKESIVSEVKYIPYSKYLNKSYYDPKQKGPAKDTHGMKDSWLWPSTSLKNLVLWEALYFRNHATSLYYSILSSKKRRPRPSVSYQDPETFFTPPSKNRSILNEASALSMDKEQNTNIPASPDESLIGKKRRNQE